MERGVKTVKNKVELLDVLICDDVRREADGRVSLMGVYPGREIVTGQLPTILSHLAFVIRLKGVVPGSEFALKIVSPDGQQSTPVGGRLLEPGAADGTACFVLQAAPVQLSVAGLHRILIRCGQEILETAFQLRQPG